ncbi:fimbrial protein [Serratia marcescens]|uniref:fimbrial protein n=1 Tax=Serratia marcescens TaxID=615 RepID=UPI00332E4DAA
MNREYSMGHSHAKLMLPCILALLLMANDSQAAYSSQGLGRVNMQGAIIDTACAIATESQEQVIEMDTVPVADIVRDGKGISKGFSIELTNCVLSRTEKKLSDWQHFQMTFDGDNDGGLFCVDGEAKGVGLQIADAYGNVARPGSPLPAGEIEPGSMRLNYEMRLVANKKTLRAGAYYSAIRFKVDYY